MFRNTKKNLSIIFVALIGATILSVWPVAAFGQDADIYATSGLEKRLKRQFRLTQSDIKRLHPLIKLESENAAHTYGRYSGEDSEDFLSLWNGVRANRRQFEMDLAADLSRRQKDSLRSARTEFESRILNLWLDDYLENLDHSLDLESFQMSCVQRVFEKEAEKRRGLIVTEAKRGANLDLEWQRITEERDRYLKEILDPAQFREYRSLGNSQNRLYALDHRERGLSSGDIGVRFHRSRE